MPHTVCQGNSLQILLNFPDSLSHSYPCCVTNVKHVLLSELIYTINVSTEISQQFNKQPAKFLKHTTPGGLQQSNKHLCGSQGLKLTVTFSLTYFPELQITFKKVQITVPTFNIMLHPHLTYNGKI